MGATKHIVQGLADFMNLHCYPVGLQTVVLRNDSETHVLDIATYQHKLREGNKLFLHSALYALSVQCNFVPFNPDISFLSCFLSISTSSVFSTFFNSVFRHNRLDHQGQDRATKLTRDGLLDQLIRVTLPR